MQLAYECRAMKNPKGKPTDDDALRDVANVVASELDADVALYSGGINKGSAHDLIEECNSKKRRSNIFLILGTTGGDPDAAYRIAKNFQNKYDRFFLFIPGYCKSAGSLIAVGANELIMSDLGELGPLDVQLITKDELWETQSGLVVRDAFMALRERALDDFEHFFYNISTKYSGRISLKTVTHIASEITRGIYSNLYAQIDPIRVGEAGRELLIARHYGAILERGSGNLAERSLDFLISGYPSHSFVIDRDEASRLFKVVRMPSAAEHALEELVGIKCQLPYLWSLMRDGTILKFQYLSSDPTDEDDEFSKSAVEGANESERSGIEGQGPVPTDEAAKRNLSRRNDKRGNGEARPRKTPAN